MLSNPVCSCVTSWKSSTLVRSAWGFSASPTSTCSDSILFNFLVSKPLPRFSFHFYHPHLWRMHIALGSAIPVCSGPRCTKKFDAPSLSNRAFATPKSWMRVIDREPTCVAMAIAAETIYYSGSFGTNISCNCSSTSFHCQGTTWLNCPLAGYALGEPPCQYGSHGSIPSYIDSAFRSSPSV